ncbi:hypothetical protein D3C73_1525150 [compost metagenome]
MTETLASVISATSPSVAAPDNQVYDSVTGSIPVMMMMPMAKIEQQEMARDAVEGAPCLGLVAPNRGGRMPRFPRVKM